MQTLKEFLRHAEAEVRSLASLYSGVVGFSFQADNVQSVRSLFILEFNVLQGRNADALILYFGEDLARCSFEQGI